MVLFIKLSRKLRAYIMAKRKKMQGKSARHGHAASPYSKYEKKPFRYSPGYYEWKRSIVARAGKSNNKYADQAQKEQRA